AAVETVLRRGRPGGVCQGSKGASSFLDSKLGNQQNARIKTAPDLPDGLVKLVKLRALQDGRKLKDAVADLLRKGVNPVRNAGAEARAAVVATDRKTGLPVTECPQAAVPQEELTPERVADILLAQEAGWHHAAGG